MSPIRISNEQIYKKLLDIQAQLAETQEGQITMSEDQAHLNQDVDDLMNVEQEEEDTLSAVEAELAELKQSNTNSPNAPLDFTGLDNALAKHKDFQARLQGDAPQAASADGGSVPTDDSAPVADPNPATPSTDGGTVSDSGDGSTPGVVATPETDTGAVDAPTVDDEPSDSADATATDGTGDETAAAQA